MIIVHPEKLEKAKSKDLIELECEKCHIHFMRIKKYVKFALKHSTGHLKYCGLKCSRLAQIKKERLVCKVCDNYFFRAPSQINKYTNNFCSKSCSAKYNNAHSKPGRKYGPERVVFTYCNVCKKEIPNKKRFCKEHTPAPIESKTISELIGGAPVDSNRYSGIRDHSRRRAIRAGILDECKICGYSKHVVTCHIKGIAEFDPDTLVSVVNALDNLIGLCPNHHWEFDHKLLSDENLALI